MDKLELKALGKINLGLDVFPRSLLQEPFREGCSKARLPQASPQEPSAPPARRLCAARERLTQ